jgi:hypothetical protein
MVWHPHKTITRTIPAIAARKGVPLELVLTAWQIKLSLRFLRPPTKDFTECIVLFSFHLGQAACSFTRAPDPQGG